MSNIKKFAYGVTAAVVALGLATVIGIPQVNGSQAKALSSPLLQTTPQTTAIKQHTKEVVQLNINPKRAVFVFGEILDTSAVVSQIYAMDRADNKSPIYVVLDSPGGSIMDGAKVINAIEGTTAPVNTVCVELCASMAAMIHSYGATRYMTDRTLLMYHDYSGQFQGEGAHMHSLMSAVERYTLRMNAHIAERSGANLQDLLIGELRQIWIDSEDATAAHFNDVIVSLDVAAILPRDQAQRDSLKKQLQDANKEYQELRNAK